MGLQMRTRELLIFVAICSGTQANAENCSELYGAIKREAMYCDFFCDQRKLAPLQQAYEAECIIIVVPLSLLSSFEDLPNEAGTVLEADPH
jgi:hypothetical protein